MAEGRSERSGKRSRKRSSGGGGGGGRDSDRSWSDSELAQAEGRRGPENHQHNPKWPVSEGLTVDELARFRRRRVDGQPRDNLCQVDPEEDLEDRLTTVYREAFHASSEELFRSVKQGLSRRRAKKEERYKKLSGADGDAVQQEDELEHPNRPVRDTSGKNVDQEGDEEEEKEREEEAGEGDKAVESQHTTLERSATMDLPLDSQNNNNKSAKIANSPKELETEYSAFVPHTGYHRPQLARRATSLRMEGDIEAKTEKREVFVPWPVGQRPHPVRLPTHLRMEGHFEASTESHDRYVPFVGARRPELLRRPTHLRIEGQTTYVPEYADAFKEHGIFGRRAPKIPETHLKAGLELFERIADRRNPEPGAEVGVAKIEIDVEAKEEKEDEEDEEKKKREQEEEEERNRLNKEEEMKLLVSKLEQLQHPPLEVPEYRDAYKDFPRSRPVLLKPDDEIGKADGSKISSRASVCSPTPHKFSQKIDQDPEYKSIHRRSPGPPNPPVFYHRPPPRRPSYSNYDPNHRTVPPNYYQRQQRSSRGNFWLDSENRERFGRINAKDDQDAFQLLDTRLHDDSVIGKPPPPINRRTSRSTMIGRASPTFRLQMSNADAENRDFGRARPYSPSFAKRGRGPANAFRILDDNEHIRESEIETRNLFENYHEPRRRTDKNSNYTVDYLTSPRQRPNNKALSSWMPPWYDSSSSTL